MSHRLLRGVFPPIPTPFSTSDAIDRIALDRNLSWWNKSSLAGYVVLGSNGEAPHLKEREKLTLIEAVRKSAPEDWPLIAGTGLSSTSATIEFTNEAASAGAEFALVLPPSFYRGQMRADVLIEHFRRLADAAAIPIILYNMPANTGIDLDAQATIRLSAHERIVGMKDSSGDVVKLARIRHKADPEFAVLAGSAGFFLPALSVGASGGILALANIAPDLCAAIYGHVRAGEWERAMTVQNRIIDANTAVTRRWGIPALKAAMDDLGLYGGPPRRPLLPFPEALRSELRKTLRAAGILME